MGNRGKIPPLVSWLIGTGTICTGIYFAISSPGGIVIKLLIGFIAMFICGWCICNMLPTKALGLEKNEGRNLGVIMMIIIALLHKFHPSWLSGDYFGWSSPVFPAVLLLSLIASILHILKIW